MRSQSQPQSFLNSLFLKTWWRPIAIITVLYVLSHLPSLTSLPVFADESIYIRWAQLIIDEPLRYAFFAMNDGKTPLFIWLLVPFQFIFTNQLFAGRIVAVFIGLLQVFSIGYLTQQLGGSRKTVILAMLATVLLPFWYFHHRMALMDGLLTLWLTLTLSAVITLVREKATPRLLLPKMLWVAIFFALALFTKLPAVLFLPVLGLWSFLPESVTVSERFRVAVRVGVSLGLGLALFGSLKLNPVFGQLFSRGSDFLYPWQDVLFGGQWSQTLPNLPTYFGYFLQYLTAPVLLLMVIGLFLKPGQRVFHLLFWSMILFLLPISILGRVVYPRYLLPAAIFATVSAALAIQTLLERWNDKSSLTARLAASLFVAVLVANSAAVSGVFISQALTNPDAIPFVPADQSQYLLEWSSGHGITETVSLIQAASQESTLAVATEGYFGTLPDALLMYFHRQPVEGMFLEGIGQPINSIPDNFLLKAKDSEKAWLVVNSHRMNLPLPPETLLAEFCRPQAAPCLQVWDITALVHP